MLVTIVPWAVLEPGQTENIVGVLFGREHPQSTHLRPSRGDGGIDVLDPVGDGRFDVYQIKYFATPLTDSRKDQIRRSLRRLADNSSIKIRHWYLVLPLNPSKEELAWFNSYLRTRGVAGEWFGLTKLEGLAAAHQDVIDYYIHDGRQRLESSIQQLRELAGIVPGPAAQLISPADTTGPLAALYQVLNRDDPHFKYDFEITASPPRPAARPNLIASVTATRDGVSVTHHVFAEFAAATDYRAVPLTFNVHPDRMDAAVAAEWDRAVRYGTAAKLPAGTVTDLNIDLPGGLASTTDEGTLWISESRTPAARPYRLRLRITDGFDQPVADALFDMKPITTGMFGRGVRAHGYEVAGLFEIEILTDIEPSGTPGRVQFRLSLSDPKALAPAAIRPGVKFLAAFHRPNQLRFASEFGPPAAQAIPIEADESPVSLEFVEIIDALAELQERLDGNLRVPKLDSLTKRAANEIIRAARLVRGETLSEQWSRRKFSVSLNEPTTPLPDGPIQFAFSGRQDITIGDQTITLEPVTVILLAAQLTVDPTESTTTVMAEPALGNSTMLTMLRPIADVPPIAPGRHLAAPARDDE